MANVIQLFGNTAPGLPGRQGSAYLGGFEDAEIQEQSVCASFPPHVLMLSDWFADAGNIESAFRILDGYEAHGEAYIAGFCEFVLSQQPEAPRMHEQQGNLFGSEVAAS